MNDFKFPTANNDKENNLTPNNQGKRQSTRFTPYLCTPKGSKSKHPFVNSAMMSLKDVCHDNLFTERQTTPLNYEFFSPDFNGRLFPKEINSNQIHMKNVDNLFKALRKQYSYNSESSSSFPSDSFLPSPDTHDSCIGSSITSSISNHLQESCYPESLLVINTSPSSFKWNRKEYRADHDDTSYEMPILYESDNGDSISQNHFESTQIFENGQTLANNFSMRRLSAIRSINKNKLALPDPDLSKSLDQSFEKESLNLDEKVFKLNQRFFDQSPRRLSSPHWKMESPMSLLPMSPRRISFMETSPGVTGNVSSKPLPEINLSPILFKSNNTSCNN